MGDSGNGILFRLGEKENGAGINIHAECGCGRTTCLTGPDIIRTLKTIGFGGAFEMKCSCNQKEMFFEVVRIDEDTFILVLPQKVELSIHQGSELAKGSP